MKRRIIIVSIMLLLLITSLPSVKVMASNTSTTTPWRDESGNIWIPTVDHQRTSNIYYQTAGFTVTRCVLGTQTPIEDEYFTVIFTGAIQDVPIGDGFTTSAFMLSESEIMRKVGQVGSWLADIESGQQCYLKIDAIMITFNDNYPEPANMSGIVMSDNNQDYMVNPLNPHPGVYDKFTKDELKYNTYGWAYPELIDTHFDHYVLYCGAEEELPPEDDELVYNGKKDATYFTWNTSDEYDLSLGIPSGEDITNGVEIDAWYGDLAIGKHAVSKQYKISYNLDWYMWIDDYDWS